MFRGIVLGVAALAAAIAFVNNPGILNKAIDPVKQDFKAWSNGEKVDTPLIYRGSDKKSSNSAGTKKNTSSESARSKSKKTAVVSDPPFGASAVGVQRAR